MADFKEEVSKLYDNNRKFSDCFDYIRNRLNMLDDPQDLDTILDEYAETLKNRVMRTRYVRHGGKTYIQLLMLGSDGSYTVQIASQLTKSTFSDDELVSLAFVNKIRELAYLGYRMCQEKDYTTVDVNSIFDAV